MSLYYIKDALIAQKKSYFLRYISAAPASRAKEAMPKPPLQPPPEPLPFTIPSPDKGPGITGTSSAIEKGIWLSIGTAAAVESEIPAALNTVGQNLPRKCTDAMPRAAASITEKERESEFFQEIFIIL